MRHSTPPQATGARGKRRKAARSSATSLLSTRICSPMVLTSERSLVRRPSSAPLVSQWPARVAGVLQDARLRPALLAERVDASEARRGPAGIGARDADHELFGAAVLATGQ